jgi:hypothetical protein
VKGSDGTKERTQDVALSILPAFYVTLDLASIDIAQGGTGAVSVNVNRSVSYTDNIFLSVEGAIIGTGGGFVEAAFSVNPVENPGSFSVLTLIAGSDVPVGSYVIIVKASSNNVEKTANITLNVN